jgi:hypothetical protein
MGKKLLQWAIIGLLLFFVATRPDSAARVTRWIGHGLAHLANGFSDFFSGIS